MTPHFLQAVFLYGLAALAVPLLIHFFFRIKTRKVDLGTIRFLRLVMEENARRRRVMKWLLLALRMIFVALLVTLFARPYLTAQLIGGEKELVIVLIDQSATMQLKGERGRLIDQAVAEVRSLLSSIAPSTRVEVAFFDHAVHPISSTSLLAESSIAEILDQLQPPSAMFGATNYGVAFAWARDICVKSPPGPKQLHVFTDLQRTALDWTEGETLPTEVRSYLHDLGNTVVNNVAITEIRTPRTWVRPREPTTVRALILNSGMFTLSEIPIVLEIGRVDGDTFKSDSMVPFSKLAERTTKRERVKLEPGSTLTVDFELPPLTEGLWQGRVMIEYDDELSFDNQRYFAISSAPPHRVLILNGGEHRSVASSETYFLETALRLAPSGETSVESPFFPVTLAYEPGCVPPNLSEFDAVIVANVGRMTSSDAAQIASFVTAGGGLLLFTGDNISEASCATLTEAKLGVGSIGETKVTVDLPWRLSKWDEKHPIFVPLSDPQHGDLRRMIFAAYTSIVPSADSRVLMEFGTGEPAILERRLGDGTVIWATVSCGRDWSDWSRSRLFLPLLHQLIGYEVGLVQGGRVRTRLVERGSSSELLQADVADVKSKPTEGAKSKAMIPGVFRNHRYTEVVNVSPLESDVERCTQQELGDRFGLKFMTQGGTTTAQQGNPDSIELQQDELWHWVACALLAVILVEGFVGNRTIA